MHVVATAGHVDHGKSTVIRMLTGMEPDRWAEERRRGLTIDLGFAWTTTPGGATVAFVDVPGHERFVANMLAGVGPVPAVLLVVAADEGWMPQTTEHVAALDALGVRNGLLVVTRSDLADPEPAMDEARLHLETTALADIPAVTVSGHTGQGGAELLKALDSLATALPTADPGAEPRLWVDRVFTVHGSGTVVTGTLPAGTLERGQQLVLHDSGQRVGVRSLQCLGENVDRVQGVARVAVNLRGLPHDQAHRGDALIRAGRWQSCGEFDARVHGCAATELPRNPTLHLGSAAVTVRVRPLGDDTVRLSLRRPLPLHVGDHGLLRDPGTHRVPAGVTVVDVRPPPLRRRGAARRRAAELRTVPDVPDGSSELRRRGCLRTEELIAMGAQPPPEACRAGDWLLDPDHRAVLAERLRDLVDRHEHDHPVDGGMTREAARRALELPAPELLAPVLDAAKAHGVDEHDGKLGRGRSDLPTAVRHALNTVTERLTEDPFAAPTADELGELGLGSAELAATTRTGALLKVAPGIYLLPEAPRLALDRLSALPVPFTLSQARRALATTRRVAVPLVELLARRRELESLPDGTHRLR